MLISTSDLNSILNDPNVIIVDTRSFKEYSENHIPNAVNLDLFAFHWIDTTKEGIENFNSQTSTLLSFLGVTPEKKIYHLKQNQMDLSHPNSQERLTPI
jgi:thiosulfate/3-mercaptopyruvate sulfurtransferase